jgi:hypothetical protein
VVQRLLSSWIRQVENVLQAVGAQQAIQPKRRPSGLAALRVERLDLVTQFLPGDQFINQLQRLLAPCWLAELLEAVLGKSKLLRSLDALRML